MIYAQAWPQRRQWVWHITAAIALLFLASSACRAQDAAKETQPEQTWIQELNKYPGLPAELSRLIGRLQGEIQFPAPRDRSRILPILPEKTIFYMAIPNYGGAAAQAVKILQEELQTSSVLRDWWAHGALAKDGPKVVDALEKLAQLHQYLGDEIILSAAMDGREPRFALISDIRKPGLKQFLQQATGPTTGRSKPTVRVMELQELVTAQDKTPGEELLVLVRPDYVVAGVDLATLRGINKRLAGEAPEFAATPFGLRVQQEYPGGVTVLGAVDLHEILSNPPFAAKQSGAFQESGFADTKYLVWDHKTVSGKNLSQAELSFASPRHGAASWLGKPGPLGSLDFVSPKAILAATLVLSSPAQIFEDVQEFARLSNSNAFAAIPQFERALNLSVRDDLLGLLGGEITIELDSVAPPHPAWRATLAVKDANHLQQTLDTLMAAAGFETDTIADGAVTYHLLRIPTKKVPVEIDYAFVDGYLVAGPTRDAVAEGIHLHRSGESLEKSQKLLASVPPGHTLEASALLYQDPIALAGLRLRAVAPELAEPFAKESGGANPTVVWVYGEEQAIREISNNSAFDVGGVLVVAAIAIPNLLRSKMAANEAVAVSCVRTVNTAQIAYAAEFPKRGFASTLAKLGPDPRDPQTTSPEHAGYIDESLACASDTWCTKSGYHFQVTAICKSEVCSQYVVVATPVSSSTGTRNFCSTSDGIVHYQVAEPLTAPITAAECKAWPALQ